MEQAGGFSATAGQTAVGTYVSCGVQQVAVVSPQSVDLGASSTPLQCYASPAWPGPGSVGCLVERSRCTHMRCHWGSEKKNKNMSQGGQKMSLKVQTFNQSASLFLFSNSYLFISILHPQFKGFSYGRVVIPRACLWLQKTRLL